MNKKDVRISPSAYHGKKTIGVTIEKYNKLEEDYAQTMVDRNSFLLEKESLEIQVKKLEDRISQLEHDLYYERRNRRISEMYNEK
jgi:hypothetical protein